MDLGTAFPDAHVPSTSKKNLKIVGCFCCAWVVAIMVVAMINSSGNNSNIVALNAIGYASPGLRVPQSNTLRSYTGSNPQFSRTAMQSRAVQDMISHIGTSPLERLAITSIKAANQCRDMSVKASDEVKSEMSSMDDETKETVEKVQKAVQLKAQDMAGVTAPLGFFDPLGFATDTPTGKLLFYREVELKHGRVCMLAALGILVAEQFHPLFGGNIDVPAYIAFQQTPLQKFWVAVVSAIAILEVFSVQTFKEPDNEGNFWMIREDHTPGDLGFDPLGLKPTNPQEFKELQTKELNNGRLAMIAAAGMIAQELATGKKIF